MHALIKNKIKNDIKIADIIRNNIDNILLVVYNKNIK